MAEFLIAQLQKEIDGALTFFKEEVATIRTNRANASLVDRVQVEAYGGHLPLAQTATITIPDARTIAIQPWDRALMKDIEQALYAANTGLTPVVDKDLIRVTLPQLTEESRRSLVKIVGQKAEESKVAVRTLRDKVRTKITNQQKAGEITEDDKYKLLKKVDEVTAAATSAITEMAANKEQEILAI